ncbi:MAG: hypothetical protein IJH34_02310 [Romboutsia sp.]|nr:hypothetical protein [Romboutsia sp.]
MKKLIKSLLIILIVTFAILTPTTECFAQTSALPYFSYSNKSVYRGKSEMKKIIPIGKNEILKVTSINKSNGRVTLYLTNLAGEYVCDVMTILPATDGAKIKTSEITVEKGIYYLKLKGAHNFWNGRDISTGNVITFARTKRLKWFF